MQVGCELAPERIAVATAEEAQRLHLVGIGRILARQVLHVELVVVAVDEGADELPVVEQVQGLRRRVDVADVAAVQIVGRQEFARSEEHTSELQSLMRTSY